MVVSGVKRSGSCGYDMMSMTPICMMDGARRRRTVFWASSCIPMRSLDEYYSLTLTDDDDDETEHASKSHTSSLDIREYGGGGTTHFD